MLANVVKSFSEVTHVLTINDTFKLAKESVLTTKIN